MMLKPCPFCGSNEIVIHHTLSPEVYYHCNKCGSEGGFGKSIKKARKAWNKRTYLMSEVIEILKIANLEIMAVPAGRKILEVKE